MMATSSCSRSSRFAGLAFAIALATTGTAAAQAQAPVPAAIAQYAEQQRAERDTTIRQESARAYPYGLSGTAVTGVALTAGKDEKRVHVTFAHKPSELTELSLSASAPLDKEAPRSSVVQLDGLANKGTVGAELRFGVRGLPTRATAAEVARNLASLCSKVPPAVPNAGIVVQSACTLTELRKVDASAVDAVRAAYRTTPWFVSISGEAGRETFKYADAHSLADAKRERWSTSGALTLGALFPSNVYASVGVRLETPFEAADTAAICAVAPPAGCPIKPLGAPTSEPRRVIEAEVRKFITGDLGLSAIVRHDWKKDESSVEIPIYFVKDKDGGLSGGVSAGYLRSAKPEETGPRFSVFVTQAFGLAR
jgi:hypothetical protein